MMQAGFSAAERADQLLVMGRRLSVMIQAEAQAMQERRLDAASADREEKDRLVHAWRVEVERIRQEPRLLEGLDPSRKEALKAISREIESTIEAHAAALEAMKVVTEGLVRRIGEEIAVSRRAPQGYGRTGAMASPEAAAALGTTLNAKA